MQMAQQVQQILEAAAVAQAIGFMAEQVEAEL
jgi:hypothetical protein